MALAEQLHTVHNRIGELQASTRVRSDAVFSDQFMRDHTEFTSFTAFCEQSQWSSHDLQNVEEVDREQLSRYVANTTGFETWGAMNAQAAEEELIDQLIS
jgi:hypothetical protein